MKVEGYSLLECLLALTLSILVLQAVILWYVNFDRQLMQMSQRYCELNAAESFAQWFRYSVENAGFRCCRRLSLSPSVLPFAGLHLTAENAFQLAQTGWQARYADPQTRQAVLAILKAQTLLVKSTRGFAVGDTILLADCANAELNQIKAVGQEKITLSEPLKLPYTQADIYLYREEFFYLQGSTLNRRESHGRVTKLVSAIADLKVTLKDRGVAAKVVFNCQPIASSWYFWQGMQV